MAETFNPFHKWLGLKPNIKNPHHFQLLGVSTKLVDEAEIKQAIEAGVNRNLKLLARIPNSPKTDSVVGKLKQRIAIAEKTLSDPKLRAAYKARLKAQIESAQKSSTTTAGGGAKSSASSNPKSTSDLIPPPAPSKPDNPAKLPSPPNVSVPQTRVANAPNVNDQASTPTAPANLTAPEKAPPEIVQATAEGIPGSAVPPTLAATTKQVPTPAPTAEQNPPLVQATAAQSPAAQSPAAQSPTVQPAIPLAVPLSPDQLANVAAANPVVNQAVGVPTTPDLPILNDGGTPDIGVVKINRKRVKRKRSILGPLMLFLMVGAGGAGAWLIYDNFDVLKSLGKKAEAEEVEKSPKVETPKKLKAVDPEKLEKLDEQKVLEEAERIDLPEENGLEMEDPDDTTKMTIEVVEPKLVSLDDSQLARFRRSLERGHRSLFRRDHELAAQMFQSANEIANEVLTGEDEQFEASQKPLVENIDDSTQVMKLIEGFWKQVQDSADSLSGAQEIVVGSQIVGFVESNRNSVIVRRSGGNIEYGYDFCPPGLALALAEQGAVADVPTWNKQKAAFYAVDQMFGLDHRAQIESFLRIAEDAGHDCEFIRRFSDFSFGSAGRPNQKIDVPDDKTVDSAMEEFRTDAGYTNIRKLDPVEALNYAQLLLQIDSPNFEQHVAILEEARQLGIRGGDASLVEDVIIEMDLYANIQRAELTCDSFSKIAEEKITPKQIRTLMERSIGFLNSPFSDGAENRTQQTLVKRLLKLSERAQMPDAYRRLNQIQR